MLTLKTESIQPQAKDYWQPSEAGRGKEHVRPESLRTRAALLTLAFCPVILLLTPGLQNCEERNFRCFKPPDLGHLLEQPQETNMIGKEYKRANYRRSTNSQQAYERCSMSLIIKQLRQ